MDDAVASDNYGEVTIEVSSETAAGDAAGDYTIVRTFAATDDAGNSAGHPDHHVQDTTAPEFTFVPADYTVECSDEMPMDDMASTAAVRSPSGCQAKPLRAMPPATTPLFARSLQPTMLETALGFADHHRRTPQRRSSPCPCRLHRQVFRRDANGRRHGV